MKNMRAVGFKNNAAERADKTFLRVAKMLATGKEPAIERHQHLSGGFFHGPGIGRGEIISEKIAHTGFTRLFTSFSGTHPIGNNRHRALGIQQHALGNTHSYGIFILGLNACG